MNVLSTLRSRETGQCWTLLPFRAVKYSRLRQKAIYADGAIQQAPVTEIVSAGNLVIVLGASGICRIFLKGAQEVICCLNTYREFIKSLHYNRHNGDLITISSTPIEVLQCQALPLQERRLLRVACRPNSHLQLLRKHIFIFRHSSINNFVEFDEINHRVLAYDAISREYELFNMDTYESIFIVHACNELHMKIVPGLLLVIGHSSDPAVVRCQALCIRTGTVILDEELPLAVGTEQWCEAFEGSLFWQSPGRPLHIFDVAGLGCKDAISINVPYPDMVVMVPGMPRFASREGYRLTLWSVKGEKIADLPDVCVRAVFLDNFWVYVKAEEEALITLGSSCSVQDSTSRHHCDQQCYAGSSCQAVFVSDLRNGHVLASLALPDHVVEMNGATAIAYDAETDELLVGDRLGQVVLMSS